jgi:hypothetical protein
MTDDQRLGVFSEHLGMISSASVRAFAEFAVLRLPDYFWTLVASTSDKGHGKDETLVDHVLGCLYIAEHVIQQFEGHWTQRQNDQLIAAVMLHDGWRCGEPGNERRFTQKEIDESGGKYSQEMLGVLRTSNDHPEVGFRQLLALSAEFNRIAIENRTESISPKDLQSILQGVRFHYGPWTKNTGCPKKHSLSWPYDTVVVQVHNIDYHQMLNANYFTRVKGVVK